VTPEKRRGGDGWEPAKGLKAFWEHMDSFDPYTTCEVDCTHDLARGLSVEDLLETDGPYLPVEVVRWPAIPRTTAETEEAA
jgi:hypothetical protein